jgi:hypothetical protein
MASDKIENKPKYYCSMIDARRMEVYTALFDANFQKTEETRALITIQIRFLKCLVSIPLLFLEMVPINAGHLSTLPMQFLLEIFILRLNIWVFGFRGFSKSRI